MLHLCCINHGFAFAQAQLQTTVYSKARNTPDGQEYTSPNRWPSQNLPRDSGRVAATNEVAYILNSDNHKSAKTDAKEMVEPERVIY